MGCITSTTEPIITKFEDYEMLIIEDGETRKGKFKDGKIYEGEFKDEKLNGQGKVTFKDGKIYEGELQGTK